MNLEYVVIESLRRKGRGETRRIIAEWYSTAPSYVRVRSDGKVSLGGEEINQYARQSEDLAGYLRGYLKRRGNDS